METSYGAARQIDRGRTLRKEQAGTELLPDDDLAELAKAPKGFDNTAKRSFNVLSSWHTANSLRTTASAPKSRGNPGSASRHNKLAYCPTSTVAAGN